ncbi:hypothetical protein H4W00_001714 [Psychrobacter sp. PL19]
MRRPVSQLPIAAPMSDVKPVKWVVRMTSLLYVATIAFCNPQAIAAANCPK